MRNTRNVDQNPKRKFKFALGSCLVVLIIIVAGIFIAYSWYQTAIYSPASSSDDTVVLEVKEGENIVDAAQALQAEGAFRSVDAFRIYLRLSNISPKLIKGSYQVPKNLNVPDLLEFLKDGPKIISARVTIPEALRYDEIADLIEKSYSNIPNSLFKKSEFLDIATNPDKYTFETEVQTFIDTVKPANVSLEGLLFPDTYNLGVDATAMDVINLLLSTKLTRLEEQGVSYTDKGRLKSFYQVITMASIVEREATNLTDMKLVADIFIKRVEEGHILGSDVTLLYALKRWTPSPTAEELQMSSPYNTRKFLGLTPTPIGNTGVDAINAVLNPTSNNYYYFIADRDGVMRYATTLSEHNQNINRYGLSGE